MNSIWTKTVIMPKFPSLEGDIKTDVLIIGGGMSGILCAHFLQEQGVNYVLAEGREICSGVTKNTSAKITSQHGLIFQKIAKQRGNEMAAKYLEANQAQFHPLKFVAVLAKNLHIYEHTYVKELKPHVAVTNWGNISFDQVIFATHFPIDNKQGMYFMKLYQHRYYVISYEQAQNVEGMYVDEAMGDLRK